MRNSVVSELTKVCYKCGNEKPIGEFYRGKSYKDGHMSKCKICHKQDVKKRKDIDPEKTKAYYREYFKTHPDKHKTGTIEYHRQWREVNKEHLKEYNESRKQRRQELDRERRQRDKISGKNKERRHKYRMTPQYKFIRKIGKSKRKQKIKSVENTLTLKQWNKIIKDQENECNLCGCLFTVDNPPTQDHILPLAKGYGLTFENTQALCHVCNSKKRDLLLPNFIQSWLS